MLPAFQGDFGAAYLLQRLPLADAEIRSANSIVRIRANAPWISVEMRGSVTPVDVRRVTWATLQEVLDLHAAKTRRPYTTRSGDRGYLTWHRGSTGYSVNYVETSDLGWSASGTIVGGGPAPTPSPAVLHHPALRFYRLSQASDDLFDAYRNAYLAFECLISGESAKSKGESELQWLGANVAGGLRCAVSFLT
jgi:hypothetical protein